MPTADADARGADVILDVVFEDGLFYLVLANVGASTALRVSCRFERPFKGLGGDVDMSSLRLFRKVEFLAPGREIRTLLDSSAAYFARREPTRLAVTVTWHDDRGPQKRPIVHELAIYREVAYFASAETASSERARQPK